MLKKTKSQNYWGEAPPPPHNFIEGAKSVLPPSRCLYVWEIFTFINCEASTEKLNAYASAINPWVKKMTGFNGSKRLQDLFTSTTLP